MASASVPCHVTLPADDQADLTATYLGKRRSVHPLCFDAWSLSVRWCWGCRMVNDQIQTGLTRGVNGCPDQHAE